MKSIINPAYKHCSDFIRSIPVHFNTGGEIIYEDRNIIKTFDTPEGKIAVKAFHTPRFFNRIIYTFFRPSKAHRSYAYGLKLMEKNIGTPTPIASIENKKDGLLSDSYFISTHLEYTGMMREFRYGALSGRKDLLRAFARFTALIHTREVLHKDYSPGNILYIKKDENYTFYLIDINRMKFGPVDMIAGCKNLRRLWGNKEMIEFIAREYAQARGFDEEACVGLTFKYHAAFWKRFTRRHNGALPYIEENHPSDPSENKP